MENKYQYYRTTIRKSVSFVGVGLHSGKVAKVTLKPSVDSRGIYFVRNDARTGANIINANWSNVSDTTLSTDLTNQFGVSVYTVEHLMSALRACGIDNVRIEIEGPEIPIMDGSAEAFAATIKSAGVSYLDIAKQGIWVTQPIVVSDEDKYAMLFPHPVTRMTMCIDFPGTAIGSQCYSMTLEGDNYFEEVAYARTFGFSDQVEALKKQGLIKGGSLINAILVDGKEIVNPEGLRVNDEFVRHKVLDAIGDLALADTPIIGHYYAYKAGHELNQKLLKKLFHESSSWTNMPLEEGEVAFANIDENYAEEYIQETLSSMKKVSGA